MLELGWPTAVWTAQFGPPAGSSYWRGGGGGLDYQGMAAAALAAAEAAAAAVPFRKFKPNRQLVVGWSAEALPLDVGSEPGRSIYAQVICRHRCRRRCHLAAHHGGLLLRTR